MANLPQSYKGMRDHLPEAMRLRQFITTTLVAVLERYGFEPLATPIVEYASTLAGAIGDDEKLLYSWQHGSDQLALRYDQTVPLARVIATNQHELTLPFKRYALGPSYRAERQQRGRYREFWQLDADIVGINSPIADAEMITVIGECLRALGFAGVRILINHRAVLSGIARVAGVSDDAAGGVYRAIDKLDKLGPDGVHAELLRQGATPEAATRINQLITTTGTPAEVLSVLRETLGGDPDSIAALDNLTAILAHLDVLGAPAGSYELAPSLARGLAYYTGCVFEAVLESPPMGSLLGGGRYDELIGRFSKRSLPTVGFAFGIERLFDLMREVHLGPRPERLVDAYVTLFDAETQSLGLALAHELRTAGISTLTAYEPGRLGNQFKEADRKGAALALVLGPDDAAAGVVQIKDLRTGDQHSVTRANIVAAVQARLE